MKSVERRALHVSREVRSAFRAVICVFEPFAVGFSGSITSVRTRVWMPGVLARVFARAWPRNPPAPVMRMLMLILLGFFRRLNV